MAVPLSPGELQQKVDAIWKHQSQVGGVLGAGGVPSVGRACMQCVGPSLPTCQ